MMTWHHRVVRTVTPSGATVWAIHEVFCDSQGRVQSWTLEPDGPSTSSELGGPSTDAEALAELEQTLRWMLGALAAPVVDGNVLD